MLERYLYKINRFVFGYRYNVSVCCIIKDENEYLNEWMTYHIKTGVEHFFIYDNDSKIKVTDTLNQIGLAKYATVINIAGSSMQMKAYQQCLKKYKFLSRWIAFIDLDEFIVPKSTQGNLPVFLKAYERFGGVVINWMMFGSGGRKTKSADSQLSSFTLRADTDFETNRHVKTIVQSRYARSVDNPHFAVYASGFYAVNENFERVDGPFSDVSVNKIQINHYYCRSWEEYQHKIKRGRSDDGEIQRTMQDFHRHDDHSNVVTDTQICEILTMLDKKDPARKL
jgi:hypothetical protein